MPYAELKDGSLLFDDPVPVAVPGYELVGVRMFRLLAKPGPCGDREIRDCSANCKAKRWWCRKDGLVPVNPGVCARCQGLVAPVRV